ncbi:MULTISPECIES: NifU family protein [Leeuwenhoekiella]|jgi:Fe-S cluster biogenesis protein NfuA|uniref:NifU-like domain protein n=1 Tax=Leeuwenhoekiella blandensis (strain CECT 7118 / CCUG 51940 / KCTC 22103 / MED217) TaxID=398720 RepID=A3XHY4_LEEBM|nr:MULTISPECIES: NifU family protein [Leeuwenhoekiella]EAQ51112.1 NifU-like domain protein [Leeuwenhoekiella blandensis MED217]MAO42457.1 NifU family protein [Leeuwenhoekiella sp.]HBT09489.1 NifU family protein [Leeuwenhoekiella sp.]HCW63928.1 NifU family protein [Leeuwenhoekiella sp.]|tara:strand:- start:83316 stop:84221 length:906 start_codon:yes stop_codon:yes gene_type:complete
MSTFNITIEPTSNPAIKKFQANSFLVDHNSYEFKNIDEAKNSPLAQQLFYLPFVKTVYISQNFIAIEKFNIVEWIDIQDELSAQIENFLNDNGVVIIEDATSVKKVPVTVYAESTPNPAVLKFVTNKKIVTETLEFKNIDEAKNAPLALALFHFPFVKEVFMDSNYVSVQKYDVAEWDDVFQEVREFIKTYIEEGKEIISENFKKTPQAVEEQKEVEFEAMDDTSKEIANIIEEYVKPAVASDGGNILFKHYDPESKNVKVILQGACSGCPSSTFTLKNGIENMLKEMLRGKINSVEAING